MLSACWAVRFDAFVTARTGHVVLRWWAAARALSDAAASLITLRRRSELMFWPLESIGVEEPMLEIGDIARTSAACESQTPAEAARAPFGPTQTMTGIFSRSSRW